MNSFASIVVFDVDETLGHFVELGIFWEVLNSIYGMRDKYHFFELLDLFPEFLRPEIISILSYIIEQKQKASQRKTQVLTGGTIARNQTNKKRNNGTKSTTKSVGVPSTTRWT